MSDTKSHFYIVRGKLLHHPNIQQGWKVYSIFPLEEFTEKMKDIAPEYELEILEIELNGIEIISQWEIK